MRRGERFAIGAQLPFVVSGNITSGAQYDLYTLSIPGDTTVTATLVCDETVAGNADRRNLFARPLGPVESGCMRSGPIVVTTPAGVILRMNAVAGPACRGSLRSTT